MKMAARWGLVPLLAGVFFATWRVNHEAAPSLPAYGATLVAASGSSERPSRATSALPSMTEGVYRASSVEMEGKAGAISGPSWAWGVERGDWKSLYAAWSGWRRTQGPGLESAREYVTYLVSTGQLSDANGGALAPAAQAGDWEVLMLALARLAPNQAMKSDVSRFDGFMSEALGQCGAGSSGLSPACANTSFLGALNALAPGLSRDFVVRVVNDAGDCGLPEGDALRPSVERVLKAERTTPWCR